MKFVKKKIERVRIISPYFDKDMSTVQKITQDLKIANAQVLSNKNDKSINLSRLPSGTPFYIPDLLERNKLRFVHAKVYIMDAGEHVYTCVGSANCTHSGLMTIPKEGNWEACLLRKHQEKNYANKFWKSFYPKRLKKDKFWIYDSLTKTPGPNYKDLSFNASLSYNLLRIYPIKNFPLKPVDGLLTFLFKSGDEEHINFEHFDFSKAIELPIEADLREQIDSDPVMVELMIKSPEKILGRAWVMQEHQLRKSNKVGSLEKAISQLQNGDPEGWNQALEIISFINKHFKYVSSEPRRRTKNRNKTGEKSLAQKVTTISGVISIDEEFHGEKDTFLFGDLIDFGRSLSKLIEKGFSKQLFNEDEDNDDPEENGIHSDERRKKTKTRRTEPQKSLKYDEIIDQLPSFSEILDKSICKPFYKYLMDAESHQESENINRFEAVLDSLTFCLKLIRFVRLEMSMQVSMPDLQVIIKRYLNEIGSLLRWFWTIYPRIKKIFRLSDEYLYDAFNNTETLNEMCICLIEFWHMNYEERLANRDLFFYALDQFWHLYGMAFVNNSTIQYLESSERFKKGRENLLFDFEKTNDILSNIERYRKRKQSIGKAFDSQVKYLYWCEAEAYHKRALDYYKTHDSHPREKFQEHQKRLKISSCLMNKCISEGKKELGKYYCAKIYEHDRVAGISEMSNELIFARCPSCGHKLDMEIYEELKQFKTLECPGCEKLFIPVDKPGSYVFREAYDPEWDMNPEEIS